MTNLFLILAIIIGSIGVLLIFSTGDTACIVIGIILFIVSGYCFYQHNSDVKENTFFESAKKTYITKIQQQGYYSMDIKIEFEKDMISHNIDPSHISITASSEYNTSTSNVYIKIKDYSTGENYMETLPRKN